MKTVLFASLACLSLSIYAEAKAKAKHHSPTPIAAQSSAKGKTIDMTAPADDTPTDGLISTDLGGKDVQFLASIYELGAMQTWLGTQAKTRAEADKVKAVGDALLTTQTEENDLLQRLAKSKGITLPANAMSAAKEKQLETQYAKLTGPKFDKTVMDQISETAQQSVDTYAAAADSSDADIQHFATQILPMVKEKLILAKRLAGKAAPPGARPMFRENVPPAPPAATPDATASTPPASTTPPAPASTAPPKPPAPTPAAAPVKR